jgi:hypothetical protein
MQSITFVGQITMVTPVDHESNPGGFVVHVTASDRGIPSEKSATVQVNIGISNVNDNIPVFEQYGYVASVNESSPLGTLVVHVLAQDRDEGLLGEVTYSIVGMEATLTSFILDSCIGSSWRSAN